MTTEISQQQSQVSQQQSNASQSTTPQANVTASPQTNDGTTPQQQSQEVQERTYSQGEYSSMQSDLRGQVSDANKKAKDLEKQLSDSQTELDKANRNLADLQEEVVKPYTDEQLGNLTKKAREQKIEINNITAERDSLKKALDTAHDDLNNLRLQSIAAVKAEESGLPVAALLKLSSEQAMDDFINAAKTMNPNIASQPQQQPNQQTTPTQPTPPLPPPPSGTPNAQMSDMDVCGKELADAKKKAGA